jgi:hypothetical protein
LWPSSSEGPYIDHTRISIMNHRIIFCISRNLTNQSNLYPSQNNIEAMNIISFLPWFDSCSGEGTKKRGVVKMNLQ